MDQPTIVDCGRGPQLSTSRVTVQDLVPYLKRRWSHQQIIEIMPVLTPDDIRAVERYVDEHRDEVLEQDRRIRERHARRTTPPAIEAIARRGGEAMNALRERFKSQPKPATGRNGDLAAG